MSYLSDLHMHFFLAMASSKVSNICNKFQARLLDLIYEETKRWLSDHVGHNEFIEVNPCCSCKWLTEGWFEHQKVTALMR